MSIPGFSPFPPIPKRSTPEADFDAKMYALFQHFAVTHRNELLAFIDFLERNVTAIEGAINGVSVGLTHPAAAKFTDLEVLGAPGVLARFRDGVASNFYVQTEGNKTTIGNAAGSSRLALMAGNQEAIEFDSAGRASGAAVQASLTDPTADLLMKVGAFGLGSSMIEFIGDIDDAGSMPSGLYRVRGGSTGTLPPGLAAFNLLQIRRAAADPHSETTQIAFAANFSCLRQKQGGVWGAWSAHYGQGNLLGMVSESGGTPTGAVIERGSNANGEYVRFADGTQLCWHSFLTSNSADSTWAYPATFSGALRAFGAAESSIARIGTVHLPEISSLRCNVWDLAGARTGTRINLMAIGRWF
ncbi:hypothetical protein R1T40_09885 [Tritonibacter scottomollicae]|uniref:Uncharacterized protein n=1 Tax=Tritonibacter scottomollicae TaxID=483013 RepID=A0ABZ0HLH0_TRISK|nr:hypothetical protein [Tritonibacter scottomollicae]WOI35010.1 hypothetical protein R1T40_09885 [Tritonibacter scottomollicae]